MPPPSEAIAVTQGLLRGWSLPSPEGGDKEARGQVLVVGGSLQNPGAVMLAAVAAMRCGAGKLQIATVEGAAPSVAPLVPEAFVQGLPQTAEGAVSGAGGAKAAELAAGARAVLVGPGVTDGAECSALLETLLPAIPDDAVVVLDAYALAHVGEHRDSLHRFGGRAVVTPNMKELALMSGVERDEVEKDPAGFAHRAAVELGATVLLGGTESWVADPDGRVWCDTTGGIGLAGSGSGDAQAGLVAGLAARGATPTQAAVWAAHVHGRAGDRLAARLGRLGYLAREVVDEIPLVLVEIEA